MLHSLRVHEQASQSAFPRWDIALGVFLAMLVAVLLAFGGSLFQGFVQLDDPYLIYGNLAIRGISLEHLRTIFTTYDPELYIPLTLLSYQLNYILGGLHTEIYHLTNLLLHAANAAMVTWLLSLLTRKGYLALFCGLLFAVHPLHTEAVVWLAGRKDLLSTFFFLASAVGYLLYRRDVRYAYLISIVCFLLALLSKVMVAPLPLVLLLSDLLLDRRRWQWSLLLDKIPYMALAGIFMFIAILGKERILVSSTLLETLLMAAKSTVFYIQKFFVPIQLSVFYPHVGSIRASMPQFLIPSVIVVSLLALAAWAWRRYASLSFGILFFLVTLSPTFLNFHKGETIFFAVDRYAYMPSIGILILIIVAASWLMKQYETRMSEKRIGQLAARIGGAILLMLCVLSFRQTGVWDSSELLYANALKLYPESVAARTSLAMIYREQGKTEEELSVLKDGLPQGKDVSLLVALGSVYDRQKKPADAIAYYEEAMNIDAKNPEPYFYLGSLEYDRGNVDKAIDHYARAIALDPSYVAASNNLGSIYMERADFDRALDNFDRALLYNPNFMEGHYNVGRILHSRNQLAAAEEHLLKADALNPDSPDILTAIAAIRVDQKRYPEALNLLRNALLIDKQHADARTVLQQLIDDGIVGMENQRME